MGTHHTELGRLVTETLGPIAVGLGRGRHPKAYPYLDPNEDALTVATSGDFHLMAGADGHHGTAASHAVVEAIHRSVPRLAGLKPEEAAVEACLLAREALALLPSPDDGSAPSATTLTIAAISGDRGASAGWGDSVAMQVRRHRPTPLTHRAHVFAAAGAAVGPPPDPTSFRLKPSDVVVVATDGLVDFLPPPWERSLAHLVDSVEKPEQVITAAAEAAAAGGGGDNLAICLFSR